MSRGLTMLRSLHEVDPQAHIYVLCFDELTHRALTDLQWRQITLITLKEFENPQLLEAKKDRTRGEYCWTCTASLIDYCLDRFQLSRCTYLDADLRFFSSPRPIFDENPSASVLITEHRYTPEYDQSTTSGRYCVQFMMFRNTSEGRRVLSWWRDACLAWCYARHEDGKFGDQKYLDKWPELFTGVHEVQHLGAGVAPWNIQQYTISANAEFPVLQTAEGLQAPVIFYHFHAFKRTELGFVDLSHYRIQKRARRYLYRPFLREVLTWDRLLQNKYSLQPLKDPAPYWLSYLKRALTGRQRYWREVGF